MMVEYLYVDDKIKRYVYIGTVGELRSLIQERKDKEEYPIV